jgi:hypothetical protein
LSFLFKLRKVIHTTPVLREVSQGFANSFGMSKAYTEFDAKIGLTETGEPTPQSSERGTVGFGQDDLAEWASQRFPNTAVLVNQYRQSQRSFRVRAPEAVYGGDVGYDSGDQGDEGDQIDEEQ